MKRRQFFGSAAAAASIIAAPAFPAQTRGRRLSADSRDPGYDPEAGRYALVTLGGRVVQDCVTADEATGECICLAHGADGKLILDGDHARREIRRGKVVITLDAFRT